MMANMKFPLNYNPVNLNFKANSQEQASRLTSPTFEIISPENFELITLEPVK
jgi:hypothetical protein